MHRRFFAQGIHEINQEITLNQEESYHLSVVLRAKPGSMVTLLDGKGKCAEAEVLDPGSKRQQALCKIKHIKVIQAPKCLITLYVSMPKGKLMNQIIKQSTEMGVSKIYPMISDRCERKVKEKDHDIWRQAALEACKQSINPFLPEIAEVKSFGDCLEQSSPGYIAYIPNEKQAFSGQSVESQEISLWIGPEGGFTENEINQCIESGLVPLAFAPWVLRVVTAVVAGLALINERHNLI